MSGAVNRGAIAQRDRVTPGKVNRAGAVGVLHPCNDTDEEVAGGSLENNDSATFQSSVFVRGECHFAIAGVLAEMGSCPCEGKRCWSIFGEMDFALALQLDGGLGNDSRSENTGDDDGDERGERSDRESSEVHDVRPFAIGA